MIYKFRLCIIVLAILSIVFLMFCESPTNNETEANPEWQTVFFDDFNRSDGDLGNNLSVEVYPAGTVEIVNNKVKITAAE